jgi:hypothetical protein
MAAPARPRSPSRTKYSIPIVYHDVRFRSKLEADWARALDALGIQWEYETEGRYFGDVFYLVDFYLPQSRQWLEVKGVFEPADCRKIHALLQEMPRRLAPNDESPDFLLIAGMANGDFFGWEKAESKNATPADWLGFLAERARRVTLTRCIYCQGWWFADLDYSWTCPCCQRQKAINIDAQLTAPLPGFPDMEYLRRIGGTDGED